MKATTTILLAVFAIALSSNCGIRAQFRGTKALSTFPPTTSHELSLKDSNSAKHRAYVMQSKDIITAPNSIYLEIGGAGVFYSINYDRMLTNNLALRFGFGILPVSWFSLTAVPLTVSWFPFSNNSTSPSKLEIGAGIDYINCSITQFFSFADNPPVRSSSSLCVTGIVGYRYQASDGGFMFLAAFTPIFFTGDLQSLIGISKDNFAPWAGISFGYGF
jgi:hypothetical protein